MDSKNTGCAKEESIKDLVFSVRNGAEEIRDRLKVFLAGTLPVGKVGASSPNLPKPELTLIADALRDTKASLSELREIIGTLIEKIKG